MEADSLEDLDFRAVVGAIFDEVVLRYRRRGVSTGDEKALEDLLVRGVDGGCRGETGGGSCWCGEGNDSLRGMARVPTVRLRVHRVAQRKFASAFLCAFTSELAQPTLSRVSGPSHRAEQYPWFQAETKTKQPPGFAMSSDFRGQISPHADGLAIEIRRVDFTLRIALLFLK